MPSEYEDKYLLLRDENTTLKKKKNEQEATIKRMYTKLAMIEEKLTKKRLSDDKNNQDDPETGGNKAAVVPVRRDLDTEKFIAALKNENAMLRRKNQSLMEKNRWLEEQCRQSKRHSGGAAPATRLPVQKRPPPARNTPRSSAGFAGSTLEKQAENARKLHRDTFSGDLEVALKKRLVIAEKQLMKLQAENEQLRSNSSRLQLKPRRDNNEDSGPSDDEDEMKANNKDSTNLELDQMKRELRDRQAQVAILNARYENLESNALAEREIQEKTLGQMEQMNRQVHKLRTQLQDAVMEKEELEIRIMKAGDQEKDMVLLREQNRRLEERMTSLCESPFINDAFQRKERIDKLFDLEKLTQVQKETITHMTEENQNLQGVIRELQSSIKQLKQAKDRVEQDLAQMTHHLMEERNARSLEAIKSTGVSVSVPRPEPLVIVRQRTPEPRHQPPEKRDACSSPVNNNAAQGKSPALSLNVGGGVVTRKYGGLPSAASFLDATGADDDNSVKHLRNRVHVLQIAHLKSMQELERCEKMLQAQTNINRELALEIEELTTSKISSSNQLQRRMKELELLCEERQQRIHTLQAEIKQLKYAREKMLLQAREAKEAYSEDSASDDEEDEVASLSESLILASRDMAPGEQLLELGIVSGHFDGSVVGVNSSTFVLCDFYDFESQSTPLLIGNRPEYSLSATFKVTVDGFFLRYLASESVVLEVHQAIRGDFKLIGKASVRLSKLLQSKGVVKEPLLAVKSICCNHDGGAPVLGTLNIILRLSTPISEIWQVHLRSHPHDILLLSSTSKHSEPETPTDALCDEDFSGDRSHSTNELQVTVFACRKLRSYGKRSNGSASRVPSSYVHYQLLGFPDVFTNIVPESSNPEYDLSYSRQAFTLEVDACLLRFLSKFRFWVTVFDDQVDLDDNSQEDGIVGRCGLMLSDLVNGENIRGWFPLKDENDQHSGDISVLIQWKDPFQVLQLTSSQRARGVNGRPIDMHSLDFDQQHALLAMFSSDMDGRVNYRQFLHYAAPSEELELLVAKLKERIEYGIDSEVVASVEDVFTVATDPRQRKRMVISMDALTKAGEKYGIFLSDSERELLAAMFGISDCSMEGKSTASLALEGENRPISLSYLLLHINPRLSCVERLLCHKIRQTLRQYVQEQKKRKVADAVPAHKIFEKFDEAKCGRVPRSAFRKCMSALGFDLMSVESEYRELVRTHTKPTSDDNLSDSTAKNTTPPTHDGIDLDEVVLEDIAPKAKLHLKQSLRLNSEMVKKTGRSIKGTEASTLDAPGSIVSTVAATTEFQRRKQAFTDRMKAIASASSKNLVYEQVEKNLQDRRVQAKEKVTKTLSRQELLQQQVRQLHVPQNIHHDAARTLQKQYRQYKELQHQNREMSRVMTTIMEADGQLQTILGKWSFADLNDVEDAILSEIERDAPEAKRTRLLSKKQLGYFLSKASRIALPPALLCQLMDYFSAKETGMVAYRPLLNFVFSTSTEESEREKKQRLSVLKQLLFDVAYASHIFVLAGDMKETGCISFRKFRDCLTRLGVQLSTKELHLVTIMLDANGYEILYHALFQILTQLPHCQQLTKALERCRRFGISLLREKILTFVSSDDECMTQEELLRVLMMLSSEGAHFEPKDSSLLFHMIAGNVDSTKRISIHELCLRLESAAKYGQKLLPDAWNKYDMPQLQRLAWNCRKLICGSYSDLKNEFERFDWQDRGFVSLTEFTCIARRNGFVLFSEDQLKGMAKPFGVKTNGTFGINYRQFLDWTTPPPPVDMDVVEEKLRKFAHDQAGELSSRQLSGIFAIWNKIFLAEAESSSDKVTTRSNFVSILQTRLRLPLDENEIRAVLYTYDPKLEDQIDCNAFLRMNWRGQTIASQAHVQMATDLARAKLVAAKNDEDTVGGDSSLRVSKAVKDVLKDIPAPASPKQKTATPDIHLGKNPTTVLSDFLDWCEERGEDLRGELEACDNTYTGFVTVMELKETLLRLGFAKVASPSSPEVTVGQLVRQFRSAERADAVNYTRMLNEITKPASIGAASRWYEQISEHLRSRIRSRANLAGKIDHADTANYARLDSAFSHFDREKRGFLTTENMDSGLRALSYELTPEQLGHLMTQICVFRNGGGELSRTEFDSFVLDPYGSRLLRKFSKQLYSEVEPHSQDTTPRVAYLSRLLIECGGIRHPSSLPKESFWTQLERALERQVTAWEKLRLQHLFDVKRDGHIAYKLFLKVMSQWRAPVVGSKGADRQQVTIPQPEPASRPEKQRRSLESTTNSDKPPCSCDNVLWSLYNQMSSIDFDSQVDIVEEYLRLKDYKHTGSIKLKQLKRVFDQIGLSLSPDAFTSLQRYFPGIHSPGRDEGQRQLVAYGKVILALQAMHEQSSDKESI